MKAKTLGLKPLSAAMESGPKPGVGLQGTVWPNKYFRGPKEGLQRLSSRGLLVEGRAD